MHIILNHSSMVPIYEQLMEQIKSEIIYSWKLPDLLQPFMEKELM